MLETQFQFDRGIQYVRLELLDAADCRRSTRANNLVSRFRRECLGGVKTLRPFDDSALDIADQHLVFGHSHIIARYHDDRHIEMTCHCGIHAAFARNVGTGHRVGAHATGICRARVITHEYYAVEGIVDTGHHAPLPWPGSHDGYVIRQSLDQQVLPIAMCVGNDKLGGARCTGRIDRGIHFCRHELAKSLVLETARTELLSRYGTYDAFHVSRD